VQSLPDPLTGGIRKTLRRRFYQLLRVLVGGIVESANLLSVAATPLAERQVNPQPGPLAEGQLVI
jgi:hypothetical protein